MDMNMAWLTYPLQLHSSREFECDPLTAEECSFYKEHWHFWYIADYVFALSTIAFFMTAIGIFILGYFLSSHILGYRRFQGPPLWQKLIATVRYLSYRGFHVKSIGWSSAPVGILFLGLAGTIYFFCMVLAPGVYYWSSELYGSSPPLATRSGWLALACMPFILATATKTNWITLTTGVSYEKLQVFHRWISYAFFILALLHTFPFIVFHIREHDMESYFSSSLLFFWTGIVALVSQAWLTFASHSTIRNFGYEFFKITHFFAAVVFIIVFFWHCDYTLTSWDYFIATAAIYVPCYAYPWLRTCFEYGVGQKAQIYVEDNGFTRITIPAKFDWTPGQHCFLRFTSFGLKHTLSAHPFTICSSPSPDNEQSELVFYIRHQKGFTAKLYQHALEQPGVSVPVLVDGPYGGISEKSYRDSDHHLVIAGGSGAGWCLPFVERFIRQSSSSNDKGCCGPSSEEKGLPGNAAAISLRVILATRDISSRIWFLRTVSELLAKYAARDSSSKFRIQVYLTGEAAQEVDLPSKTAEDHVREVPVNGHGGVVPGKEFEGRPQLEVIVQEESAKVAEAGESLSVFVCGPTTMLNDVRNAVAAENLNIIKGSKAGGVYLHTEHFSWA